MHTGFNHVMLWVKDLQLAKKFYGEGLGMPFISEEYRMPRMFNKAYFGSESMVLELFEWEDPNEYPDDPDRNKRSGITHFCIWVDSIDKTSKELKDAGFANEMRRSDEIRPGLTPGTDMYVSMVYDPEGNPIEVFELAEKP